MRFLRSILFLIFSHSDQAKMDEQEEVIPAVEELNNCTDNAYTPELIVQMETILLNQLRWDVCVVTPAHFLGVYLQCSLSETDTLNGLEIQNLSALRTDLAKSASFFVDMSRQGTQVLLSF